MQKMVTKDFNVEVVGEIDLSKLNNNFYEILLNFLLALHKQEKS